MNNKTPWLDNRIHKTQNNYCALRCLFLGIRQTDNNALNCSTNLLACTIFSAFACDWLHTSMHGIRTMTNKKDAYPTMNLTTIASRKKNMNLPWCPILHIHKLISILAWFGKKIKAKKSGCILYWRKLYGLPTTYMVLCWSQPFRKSCASRLHIQPHPNVKKLMFIFNVRVGSAGLTRRGRNVGLSNLYNRVKCPYESGSL